MDSGRFQAWLEEIDSLTEAQQAEVQSILAGRSAQAEVSAALEAKAVADRCCPHCQKTGAISRGRANGMRRFYCRGCGKTFNALTGTSLAHLHHKERWLDFAQSLSARETITKSAARCAVASTTAFRWRHRFLKAIKTDAAKLSGIVEADETYVLESRKGSRIWQKHDQGKSDIVPDRKPRRRGSKASKRGLSKQQVPVLVAADRNGTTVSAILSGVSAKDLGKVLRPVIQKDALLVTDAGTAYGACARDMGISHQALGVGEHVRGEVHIQTVNSRHERLKDLLRRHRGVATKYLDSYLKWFHLATIRQDPTPRACLNAAMGWTHA